MAKFEVSGMDETLRAMAKANIMDDETLDEMVQAGGSVVQREIRSGIAASRFRLDRLAGKVAMSRRKRDKNGNSYTTITLRGKNARGERNATVAFVLNYGRGAEYGRIEGDYFWTRAAQNAQEPATEAVRKIAEQKLKERGLL